MTIPETIWAWQRYDDRDEPMALGEWYTQDVDLDGDESEYLRADIADARVAAAYETAAQEVDCGCKCRDAVLAAETKVDRWYACAQSTCAAMSARDIRALTPNDAKAALEAVRREARAEALREAAEIAECYIAPEMGSLFYQGINSGCRAIKGRISALIDKETTE